MTRETDQQDAVNANQIAATRKEQLDLLFASATFSLVVNLYLALTLAYFQREIVSIDVVGIWMATIALILVLRVGAARGYKAAHSDLSRQAMWGKIYLGLLAANGLVWGGAGLWLTPEASLPHQVFTVLIIAGITTGALASLSCTFNAFLFFAVPAVVPVFLRFLFDGGEMQFALAIMTALFLAFLIACARRQNRLLVSGLENRFAKQNLVIQLHDEKQELDKLNANLLTQVTVRDLAQRELHQSEVRFKGFAESASDWFWEMDADLRYSYFSNTVANFINGISPDDNIGKTRRELGWADYDEAKWEMHLADLEARRPFKNFRYLVLRENHQEHHWEVSGAPYYDDAGIFEGYRGAGRDVTAAVQNAEQMETYIHELDYQREILEEQAAKGVELAERLDAQKSTVEANEEKLRAIFQTASEGIITINDKGIVQSFNRAAEQTFDFQAEDVIGRNISMLMPEDIARAHDGYLAGYLETGNTKIIGIGRETTGQRSDGSVFPMRLSVSEMNIHGQRMFTGLVHDITESKAAEEKIRHMATHDALTNLPSLHLGKDRLNEAVAYARRHRNMTALMFIDLDGFKQVNDTLGHDAGDMVLIETARRLKECVRETDTIARIGGDEFLAIVTEADDAKAVEVFAKKIIAAIGAPYHVDREDGKDTAASIGASIGIALFPIHGTDAEALVKAADRAMYVVKKAGKNNFAYAQSNETNTG